MQIVLGLDLSLTKTGYCVLKEKGVHCTSGVIRSKPAGDTPSDELKRILNIVYEIDELIHRHNPNLVVIENLAFGVTKTTAITQLSGLNYFAREASFNQDIPFLLVAPTTLKKFITGSGKGEKDMMMMEVYKEYGFEAEDNNECDAYCLAVIGLAVLGKPIKNLKVPQKEVISLLSTQHEPPHPRGISKKKVLK